MDRSIEDDQMSDQLDASTHDAICHISTSLLREVSGEIDLKKITVLDLHLRNPDKGKIRKIEGLDNLLNVKLLNLSYNAIIVMEGLSNLHNVIELNLAENGLRKVIKLLHSFEVVIYIFCF